MVTLDTVQSNPQPTVAALGSDDPGAAFPGRIVADMLVVSALQLGDPVPLLVLVKARDPTLHRSPLPCCGLLDIPR